MAKKSLGGSSKKGNYRKSKSWPFKEGDWFAVPLHPREVGFGIGLAARVSPTQGTVFGYFFALRFPKVPSLQGLQGIGPRNAIWREMFVPLGLLQGEWPIIGQTQGWQREDWPMPWFVHRDQDTQRPDRLTRYDDNDPFVMIEEILIPGSIPMEELTQYQDLPVDGLAGHGYVEKVLSKKISEIEKNK